MHIAIRINATTLGALLIVLLLISSLAACEDTEKPIAPRELTVLRLQAQGKVEAVPDRASFQLQLSCRRSSSTSARNCLIDESRQLSDYFTAAGIAEQDLLTTNVTLAPEYDWTKDGRRFLGYRAATTMQVTLRRLELLDTLYTELLDKRKLELYGLNYEHSAVDSLQAIAYQRALVQAEYLADQLTLNRTGVKRRVLAVSNVRNAHHLGQPSYSDAVATVEAQALRDESTTLAVHSGLIRLAVDLYVDFELSPS